MLVVKNIIFLRITTKILTSIGGSTSLFISTGFIFINIINELTLRKHLFKTLYEFHEEESN